MQIRKFVCGPIDTNCYLVWDEQSRNAMLVDAPKDCVQEILEIIEKYKLKLVLLANTHGHWDHIGDNAVLKQKTGAMIAVHKKDEERLLGIGTSLPFEIVPTKADKYLDEGDVIKIGGIALEVIETPGHTQGSVCLFEPRKKVLFSGDTLFAGSYGRTDFPGGDRRKMAESLKKLFKLPPDTKVFPGHGDETLLGSESWIGEMI